MNNEDVPHTDAEPCPVRNEKSPKLPYTSPELKQYGDIRELTQGTGATLPTDPGGVSTPVTG